MEKRPPVNQKNAGRFLRVRAFLQAHKALFANQGTVAATWRTYRGKRLGPYFQLAYRDRGRQHWDVTRYRLASVCPPALPFSPSLLHASSTTAALMACWLSSDGSAGSVSGASRKTPIRRKR